MTLGHLLLGIVGLLAIGFFYFIAQKCQVVSLVKKEKTEAANVTTPFPIATFTQDSNGVAMRRRQFPNALTL
jgi:hypothetical protein